MEKFSIFLHHKYRYIGPLSHPDLSIFPKGIQIRDADTSQLIWILRILNSVIINMTHNLYTIFTINITINDIKIKNVYKKIKCNFKILFFNFYISNKAPNDFIRKNTKHSQ